MEISEETTDAYHQTRNRISLSGHTIHSLRISLLPSW